jgi:hypothetical protein
LIIGANARRKLNLFDRFRAVDYESVLEIIPARQDFDIIGLSSVKNGLYCNV